MNIFLADFLFLGILCNIPHISRCQDSVFSVLVCFFRSYSNFLPLLNLILDTPTMAQSVQNFAKNIITMFVKHHKVRKSFSIT